MCFAAAAAANFFLFHFPNNNTYFNFAITYLLLWKTDG